MTAEDVKSGKTTAIIAYITVIGAIIAIFMNLESKNPFARFHIRQAFGIFVTFFALTFIVPFFDSWGVSIAFYIFIITLWGYGIANAFQGNIIPIPLLGKYFQKWFTFIE